MADLKISQLTETTNPSGTDVLPIVSEGITKKVTLDTIASFVSSSDSQTLSFNESTKDLSISSGNTVSLSALVDSSTDTGVRSLTSDWQNTFNTVLANSATAWNNSLANQYTHTNFLPLSGGTISGTQVISTSSVDPALRITQIGSGPVFLAEDSSNPDAHPFYIDALGSFSIGASALANATNNPSFRIVNNQSNSPGQNSNKRKLQVRNHNNIDRGNGQPIIELVRTRSGDVNDFGTYTLSANDNLGDISWYGHTTEGVRIRVLNKYASETGAVSGSIIDIANHIAGTGLQTSIIRIDENKIGIGTTTPNETLTVVGNISATGTLQLSLTSTPPSNTTTPAAWEDIQVGGVTYKIPLYL